MKFHISRLLQNKLSYNQAGRKAGAELAMTMD